MISTRTSGSFSAVSPYGQDVEFITYMSGSGDVESVGKWPVSRLWRTQPHLRTVSDFIAQQVGAMGLHVYERQKDGGRARVRDSRIQALLTDPNTEQTGDELVYALALQLALYDDAFLYVAYDKDGRLRARVVPAPWVTLEVAEDRQQVLGYIINGVRLNRQDILRFPGTTPDEPTESSSPVHTLRVILDSEQAAHAKRRNIFTKGPRVGGIIQRPKDAPTWTDAARRTFDETWAAFKPGGERAGDAMLLEDGMTYVEPSWDADTAGYRDGAVLSLSTVAQTFHIHPAILGVPGAVGYSGVREIRQALVGDSLAWMLKRIESRLTNKLLPLLGEKPGRYVEFNREARLQGSFEEQAVIMRQVVGAPFMTVNEARALRNMTALDDGDSLVRPLNVTTEGEHHRSPEDDAAQRDGMKQQIVTELLGRAGQVIASKRGAGVADIDYGRWLRELHDEAAKAGTSFTDAEVNSIIVKLGGSS